MSRRTGASRRRVVSPGRASGRRVTLAAVVAGCLLAAGLPAQAQQSAGYDLREHVLNSGGHPAAGITLASPGYRMSLDALGGLAGGTSSGPSFQVSPGFAPAYPPPGEVTGVQFRTDNATLTWNVEPGAGTYQVYRDLLSTLQEGGTGACWQNGLAVPQTSDAQGPAVGAGFFYLVTSRNPLGEEGTKGFRSSGLERPNPLPCP